VKFTRSKDGVKRTTILIRFRVGYDLLESAAAHIVWGVIINYPPAEVDAELAERLASLSLNKRAIERTLREELQEAGYQGWGQDDEYFGLALQAAQPHVRRLYPDAY
jgi:hypothetical protein